MKKTDLAFTRTELLFCILGATLVTIPAVSLLASNKSESQRVVCFNNLRQIGQGFLGWANEHNEMFPWQVTTQLGGTFQDPGGAVLWWQFSFVSNYLGSPKVLVCPADTSAPKAAEKWRLETNGLASVSYRNNAITYSIGLHAVAGSGASLLSGDRNFRASSLSSCSYLYSSAAIASQFNPLDGNIRWTNAIHGTSGNLLFGDGSVQYTSSAELRTVIDRGVGDNSYLHFLGK